MTISIDASTLLGFYQARSGASAAGSSTSTSTKTTIAPTPPWSAKSQATSQSALVTSILSGRRFIDTDAARLSSTITNADDYKNLFGLYQGLSALQGVAQAASKDNLSAVDLSRLTTRFAAGQTEVSNFLAAAPFDAFTVSRGAVSDVAQTTVGVKREVDTLTTGVLFTGSASTAVPAFQGTVQFSVALKKASGTVVNVDFDLAEMGSTPRTMSNTVIYLNSKLQAAGVTTRFANVRVPAVAQTVGSGDSQIKLPVGADGFSLQLKGTAAEIPTFSAPVSKPAVYIATTTGRTTADAVTGAKADAQRQVLKFDTTGDTSVGGASKLFGRTLPSDVAAVRSTATGPDGTLYVLADITGPAADGQTIKGAQDVALLKYDSSGALVFSRTLGASTTASGYALAVSADGASVAVSGSVTGTLDGALGTASTTGGADGFVTVFNAAGEESWTARRTSAAGVTPAAVSFGPDGKVYVVGSTPSGAVQGGAAQGGQDGWLQAFSDKGAALYTAQIGTAGADRSVGVSADATGVAVASVENGHAVLRRFDFDQSGKLQPGAVRDLGDLQGGEVTGLGRAADGSLVLAGSTHNGALAAGSTTTAYAGGRSAFVANVSATLSATASDRLTYVNLGADATAAALTISGGQAYIAGQVDDGAKGKLGYGAQIDFRTGAVGWKDTTRGADNLSAPSAIAVDAQGVSSLDRLGLPRGTVDFVGSQSLTANTSLRVGDQFFVRSGTGAAKPVSIEAGETLKTLAVKINRALGFAGKAEVTIANGRDQLKITPVNGRTDISLQAGTGGRDALTSLGLSEGLVTVDASTVAKLDPDTQKTYGLKLPTTLSISTAAAAKSAAVLISSAMTTLQLAYSDLAFPAAKTTKASTAPGAGQVSAYQTSRIADYQLALSRLGGS